jgi:cytochrome c peroxidase
MHNGVFKSLEEVVHFYNTRNIAVNKYEHQISFDLRVGPPAGYTRLQPPPEVLDNVQNAAGLSPAQANGSAEVASNGQVGNLQLSAQEEANLVSFLKILSDQ